ncbi:MAG: histidine-type phosphatase [Prevotella sp.]|nr:histidine-type phosphatase [Prevotella sp.]
MRKILLSMVLAIVVTGLEAQNIRDEIRNNLRCSAGNYMAYPGPTQLRLTKAPAGKQPFYISHYGRYGSRYHNRPHDYSAPYQTLAKADSLGALTDLGKDVLHRLDLIQQEADEKYGELTILGAVQQHLIIKRMVERFPEVFTDNSTVDARSTTLLRCYLTMENAMVQLSRMCPNVKIHHNATHRDMYFLNQMDRHLLATKMDSATTACYKAFSRHLENNGRLMSSLFSDTAYIRQYVNTEELNASLFKIASNLQNMDVSHQMTLYDLFTDDEIYRNWERENAWWYVNYGFCTLNGGKQPYSQRNLLRKIINDADSCIQRDRPNVQLRFGHETVLLPLVCLLEINNFGLATDDLDALDRRGWAVYKVIPMAANLQFVFYRESPDDKDVMFKVLLNENEVRLPLKSIDAPYYHWRDFRNYYLKKLDAYEE